jgi:hypothetical protein
MALLRPLHQTQGEWPANCPCTRLLDLILVATIPLQPAMNGVPKIERNLRPSPPKRAKYKVDCSQPYHHVVTEEKSVEEKGDEANRDNAENQPRNEREKKEQ